MQSYTKEKSQDNDTHTKYNSNKMNFSCNNPNLQKIHRENLFKVCYISPLSWLSTSVLRLLHYFCCVYIINLRIPQSPLYILDILFVMKTGVPKPLYCIFYVHIIMQKYCIQLGLSTSTGMHLSIYVYN